MAAPVNELWRVARLLRPWGRAGEWLVAPDGGDELLAPGRELFLRAGAEQFAPVRVAAAIRRGGKLMVRLEPGAPAARGAGLYLPAAEIPDAGDPAPWLHDLIGAELHDDDRGAVGVVRELLEGPAHPWLKVKTAAGERLVPYVEGYDPRFDREGRVLTMTLPPGLLED